MLKINAVKLFLIFLLINSGCNYQLKRIQTEDGKHYLIREYKNQEVEEKYKQELIFKNPNVNYYGYKGGISSGIINNLTYFQYDSVRMYVFTNIDSLVESLFSSGLLCNEVFYCQIDSFCKPPVDIDTAFSYRTRKILGWEGPALRLSMLKEITQPKTSKHKRQFVLWITPGRFSYFIENRIYYVEVTNDIKTNKTPLKEFVKNGHITVLKWGGWAI